MTKIDGSVICTVMPHTYVDWTLETVCRPFYVGKGNEGRVRNPERNDKHRHVRRKYGHRREVVFTSLDESDCFREEVRLIAELHTFIDDPLASDIVCNFTTGGEGGALSQKTRRLLSERLKAHRRTQEHCNSISKVRKHVSVPKAQGRHQSPEHIQKRVQSRAANKAAHVSTKGRTRTKLSQAIADEIRRQLAEGVPLWELSHKHDVSDTTIRNIRNGKIYRQ